MTQMTKEYFWVVVCKNHLFHNRQNRSTGHIMLLGETDEISRRPALEAEFSVKCDNCGRTYDYNPGDVLRFETEPPASFVAHPLFLE